MKPLREWMRDRRVAALLAVLAVALVGYRIATVRPGRPPSAPDAVQAPPPVEVGVQTVAEAPDPVPAAPKAEARRAPSASGAAARWSWNRNPFLPAGGPDPAGPGAGTAALSEPGEGRGDLSDLKGTVIGAGSGIAIFGTRLVPAGEKTGEWQVDRVRPYGVTVRRGNEVREVEMFKPPPAGPERTGGKR